MESYFYLFAVRDGDHWLAWEEVQCYAGVLGLPTVPVLYAGRAADLQGDDRTTAAEKLKAFILAAVAEPSSLSDPAGEVSPREGAVARVARSFTTGAFPACVFKWVRKGHVRTDQHWTRNWQRAKLYFEK